MDNRDKSVGCVGRLVRLKLSNRSVVTARSFHNHLDFKCFYDDVLKTYDNVYGLVMEEYQWNGQMNARLAAETFIGVEHSDRLLYVVYFDNNLMDLWENLDFEWVD